MTKRIFAAILWFYAGLYGGAMLAAVTGVSAAVGPALGLIGAASIALGPQFASWSRSSAPAVPGAEAQPSQPVQNAA